MRLAACGMRQMDDVGADAGAQGSRTCSVEGWGVAGRAYLGARSVEGNGGRRSEGCRLIGQARVQKQQRRRRRRAQWRQARRTRTERAGRQSPSAACATQVGARALR